MGKVAGILIGGVGVVSSNPTGGILFLFKTLDVTFVQKCQICVENEKPDWLIYKIKAPFH